MKTVYLAGPITGLHYDQGQSWRLIAESKLAESGIQGFSPLRGKGYLRQEGELSDASHGYWERYGEIMSKPKSIVARDRNDCTNADLVLVNLLGAERVSIGSVMEIAWADLARVPIVLLIEPANHGESFRYSNPHDHAMLLEVAGWVVHDLETALTVAKSVLLP